LIDAALQRQRELAYFPIDIDAGTLSDTADALASEYSTLHITGIVASFEDGLRDLTVRLAGPHQRTLMLFLGSTIGNLDPAEQREILRAIRAALRGGDALLLGADTVKSEEILIPAYDDALGVTAAFNKNLLVRINRELGGTFDIAAFRHEIRYDRDRQRIEMHLVSTIRQRVALRAGVIEIDFDEGESIHTENSYKFTREAIESLARDTGFTLERQWNDRRGWFGENLLMAI
jgi:dimethylhistidine N-methyltransferase